MGVIHTHPDFRDYVINASHIMQDKIKNCPFNASVLGMKTLYKTIQIESCNTDKKMTLHAAVINLVCVDYVNLEFKMNSTDERSMNFTLFKKKIDCTGT